MATYNGELYIKEMLDSILNHDSDIKDVVVHDMGNNTRAYLDARKYCEASKKTRIYNATRGGKLEVFERVDFDSLFT